MRKLSLKTYSIYTLQKMTFSSSLNTKILLTVCMNDSRLFAPLLCYLFAKNYKVTDNLELKEHLNNLYKLTSDYNEEVLLNYLQHSPNKELNRYFNSYQAENERRDEDQLKNRYRELFKKYQTQFKLSDYYLCKAAKMNSGNFNSFYKHNKNNCMSLSKCELLFDELSSNFNFNE